MARDAEGVGPQPRQLSRRHHPFLPRNRRRRARLAGRARRRALSRPDLSQLQQGRERCRRRFGQHARRQHPADMGGRQRRALREGADILRARIRHHRPRHLGGAAGHAAGTDERQSRTFRARRGAPRQSRSGLTRKDKRRMGVGIGLGCAEFPFSGAAAYWRWIDMCEAGGVDSIWQTDRIVGHQPFLESMTTMAALAGRTRRMRVGMNVVSLTFRDPVLLAKQCATIDMLSDGRLLPAFGIGSPLAPEWEALGMDTKTRGRKTDECLEIIRRLWREESVDFSGTFYKLKRVTIAPKPVQPDLPMWIGGSSDAAIRRTARIGTGWQAGGGPPAEAGRGGGAVKARDT